MCVVGLGLGDTLGDEFRLEDEELWKGFSRLFDDEDDKVEEDDPHLFGGVTLSFRELVLRPVCTPPTVFLSVGIPPANNPPMPGRGPGAPPEPP